MPKRKPANAGQPPARKTPPAIETGEPGDISLRGRVADPGSHQSSHGSTGFGGDDEHADADDYKVKGQSRG